MALFGYIQYKTTTYFRNALVLTFIIYIGKIQTKLPTIPNTSDKILAVIKKVGHVWTWKEKAFKHAVEVL